MYHLITHSIPFLFSSPYLRILKIWGYHVTDAEYARAILLRCHPCSLHLLQAKVFRLKISVAISRP